MKLALDYHLMPHILGIVWKRPKDEMTRATAAANVQEGALCPAMVDRLVGSMGYESGEQKPNCL